jgi:hypothetical protein
MLCRAETCQPAFFHKKRILSLLSVITICASATLHAGTVTILSGGPVLTGKVTLTPATIHVEATSVTDLKLPDVLEAHLGDTPFQLNYFSSAGDTAETLPTDWKAQDIGAVTVPGSVSYAAGVFTLTSDELDNPNGQDPTDHYFFVGRPWKGDGQWTVRLKGFVPADGVFRGGFQLRDSLDPFSANIGMSAWDSNNAYAFARDSRHGTWGTVTEVDNFRDKTPMWFRMTRRGFSLDYEVSSDGKTWDLRGQPRLELADNGWAGLFINNHADKTDQKVMIDQVLFTPVPGISPGQIVVTGVVLRSGSFLAGSFDGLNFDPAAQAGNFIRAGKPVTISTAQTGAVVYRPVTRARLIEAGKQVGILMRNDDILIGDFQAIGREYTYLNSMAFGPTPYSVDQMNACLVHPIKLQPAEFEVRLTDGSVVYASGIGVDKGTVVINEVSGVKVSAAPEEIAQFRAGPDRSVSLLDQPSKITPSKVAAASAVAKSAPATNAAPSEDSPPVIVAMDQTGDVRFWSGPNREEIMAMPVGKTVDFPLQGKFSSVAMNVVMLPGTPANTEATVRVLADGKEIGRTPVFKAGDAPEFVRFPWTSGQTVSLVADSTTSGLKVLVMDPVAIRDAAP